MTGKARRTTTQARLGGLLSNLVEQSAGAFPTTEETVDQVVPAERRMFVRVQLDHLRPNPRQPRKIFDEVKLRELGDSIKEHGLQQPLLIRAADVPSMYDIIIGERRWRAMRLIGWTETEAIEVLHCSDEELETIALVENVHRTDLTPYELAEAYWRLHKWPDGSIRMNIGEVAKTVQQSKDHVDSHLAIIRAPETVRRLIIDDPTIPLRTIRDLAQVENADDLDYLIEEVRNHRITANDVSRMLRRARKVQEQLDLREETSSRAASATSQAEDSLQQEPAPGEEKTLLSPEQSAGESRQTEETTQPVAAQKEEKGSPSFHEEAASVPRNLSPALALAALETQLQRKNAQVQKIVSELQENIPVMDQARKAAVRNQAQAWIILIQQLLHFTQSE